LTGRQAWEGGPEGGGRDLEEVARGGQGLEDSGVPVAQYCLALEGGACILGEAPCVVHRGDGREAVLHSDLYQQHTAMAN
jgi:hypothetical protein